MTSPSNLQFPDSGTKMTRNPTGGRSKCVPSYTFRSPPDPFGDRSGRLQRPVGFFRKSREKSRDLRQRVGAGFSIYDSDSDGSEIRSLRSPLQPSLALGLVHHEGFSGEIGAYVPISFGLAWWPATLFCIFV